MFDAGEAQNRADHASNAIFSEFPENRGSPGGPRGAPAGAPAGQEFPEFCCESSALLVCAQYQIVDLFLIGEFKHIPGVWIPNFRVFFPGIFSPDSGPSFSGKTGRSYVKCYHCDI